LAGCDCGHRWLSEQLAKLHVDIIPQVRSSCSKIMIVELDRKE
jgi:hypothetical protein